MPEHERGRRDGGPLRGGRRERPQQHAPQDGGDRVRVRSDGGDHRVDRADTRLGQPGDHLGEQPQRDASVAHVQQEGDEGERRRRGGGLEYRHLQDKAANPLGRLRGGEQAHIGPKRDPAKHRLVKAELVEQGEHVLGVQVHAVRAWLHGLLALAVPEQVEQDDAVPPGGKRPGKAAAQLAVEEDRVQPHEHPVPAAVDLVVQPVLADGKGVRRALDCWPRTSLGEPGPKNLYG